MEIFHDVEFWIAVSFLVALGVLWNKAGPIITSGLDARAAKIRADLDEARKLRETAEATLAEYQRKQRDALAEAHEIVTRAKADAERAAAQAKLDLEAAIKRREAAAAEKIAQAEAKALAEVRRIAVDVAIEATRILLRDGIDAQRGASLIDAAIADLPARLH
jgi:F-type H+-transporting ATPase subunit b